MNFKNLRKKLGLSSGSGTPKCVLNAFCDEQKIARPQYEIVIFANFKDQN